MGYRLGIDIGGTFTDFVLIDSQGRLTQAKVISTPDEPAIAIRNGLERLASRLATSLPSLLAETDFIVHGSTAALNALIEGKGAKTGLLCTEGFRDSIEIRLAWKERRYDWKYPPPPVLVPRYLRLPVRERITRDGAIHIPLVEDDVYRAIETLKRNRVQSVAVCLLWSFRNPAHERRIGEILAREFPETYVSLSVDILPEIREFDRASTTVVNAYVGPVVKRYVDSIERLFESVGYRKALRYMQSNSGMASGAEIVKRPVYALGSGPAAAPAAGLYHARQLGQENILTVDMGGTSCDVCLVPDGKPDLAKGLDIVRYRLRVPMIKVNTVGAGGGSIAHIDAGGLLQVGPRSAGAHPGPACYGQGGVEPTVTDADVILGYLRSGQVLGGTITVRCDLAEEAITAKVAAPLGLSVEAAAMAVLRIVTNNMARAIAEVSIERGYDPRDFALMVAGGCGPVHAWMLAEEIGVDRVYIPRVAPNFCAFGEVVADLRHEYSRAYPKRMDAVDPDELEALFEELEASGSRALLSEGVSPDRIEVTRYYEIRYVGQIYECLVSLPKQKLTEERLEDVVNTFHQVHERLYTYAERDNLCELMNVGATVYARQPGALLEEEKSDSPDPSSARIGSRPVYFKEYDGIADTPVFSGERLKAGNVVHGPAIVEDWATSVVVFPGCRLELAKNTYIMSRVSPGDAATRAAGSIQ